MLQRHKRNDRDGGLYQSSLSAKLSRFCSSRLDNDVSVGTADLPDGICRSFQPVAERLLNGLSLASKDMRQQADRCGFASAPTDRNKFCTA